VCVLPIQFPADLDLRQAKLDFERLEISNHQGVPLTGVAQVYVIGDAPGRKGSVWCACLRALVSLLHLPGLEPIPQYILSDLAGRRLGQISKYDLARRLVRRHARFAE